MVKIHTINIPVNAKNKREGHKGAFGIIQTTTLYVWVWCQAENHKKLKALHRERMRQSGGVRRKI